MSEPLLSIQEVAKFLRIHPITVFRLTLRKLLPGFKVGGVWRFRREDIDQVVSDGLKMDDPKKGGDQNGQEEKEEGQRGLLI